MTGLLLLIAALLAAPIAQAGKFSDFNNDGKSDIFWRNIATAENYVFPMNGTTILPTEGSTRTVPPTDWRAIGQLSTRPGTVPSCTTITPSGGARSSGGFQVEGAAKSGEGYRSRDGAGVFGSVPPAPAD